MKLSYSLGSLLSIEEVLSCADVLSKYNPDTVWIPETWGMENFSILSAVSNRVKNSKIGSSIINIYSRSPALIAMGAATIDTISNKRMILGLGVSSPPIVSDFHGYDFDYPLERMKEYVEIIKLILSGKQIIYDGVYFSLKNFKLLIKPPRKNIPIYLAAVNKKMIELSWELADGVIFYLRPLDELETVIKNMQSKRKIDVTCQIITAVSTDSDKAINRAKETLGFYVAVGKIYREFLAKNGFKNETSNIFEEFKKSGFKNIHEYVSESMVKSLTICGNPEECKKKLQKFRDAGIHNPIIQFNPVGNIHNSFELTTKTFSGEDDVE